MPLRRHELMPFWYEVLEFSYKVCNMVHTNFLSRHHVMVYKKLEQHSWHEIYRSQLWSMKHWDVGIRRGHKGWSKVKPWKLVVLGEEIRFKLRHSSFICSL